MTRFYRFPPNRRAADSTLYQQIAYMSGEVDEIMQAYWENEGDDRIIEETLDAIQTGEGILRKFPFWRVLQGLAHVKKKCRQRGDY